MQETSGYIYNLEIEAALAKLRTTAHGLSHTEAKHRLARHGPNQLIIQKPSLLKRVIEPFKSAFVGVLLIAALLSVLEKHGVDAIIITILVGVNAGIYYFQQYSVGRVLKTLRGHDVQIVHAIRDGQTIEVASVELTYGDIIHVQEGMKVPADGRLIEVSQLECDEALLTGESLPVHKQAGAVAGEQKLYNQRNMLFKGTYVRSGSGLMLVTGIGTDTQLGGIAKLAGTADVTRSPIEYKIDDLTRKLIFAITGFAAIALLLAIYRGIAVEEAIRFSLVIVVSAIPEGLPVALTVVLLLSARRMARVNALVKKISSIETMGAITFIATDKTGTITQNRLSVVDKHTTHETQKSFEIAIYASLNGDRDHAGDSLDAMLLRSVDGASVPGNWEKVKEYAFNQKLRLSGVLWQHPNGYSLFVKGAPEHILERSSEHHRTDTKIRQTLEAFTSRGYRTIAFAHQNLKEAPSNLEGALKDMIFDGFVGLSDPLRPRISHAVIEARKAGIKVVMLTGDHVATARFVADQAGITTKDTDVADSRVLAGGDADAIRDSLQETTVYGRVLPEHKFALLKATKGHEITAMTGDGVNDVPALVEADAGIAMGSGTDAAKDASDIVLLDDNFHTIVAAIRVGRTALANIRKMVMYLLGTSGGEVLTILFALLFNLQLPVAAIQILWINLVTDGFTVMPLGLSPAEPKQMLTPPRSPRAALLNMRQGTRVIVMASVMSASVLFIYKLNLPKGHEYAQTLAFMSLIVVQWTNALNANFEYRSWVYNFIQPNYKLLGAIAASVVLQFAVFTTHMGTWLSVVPVRWQDALLAILVPMLAVLVAVDIHKFAFRPSASTSSGHKLF